MWLMCLMLAIRDIHDILWVSEKGLKTSPSHLSSCQLCCCVSLSLCQRQTHGIDVIGILLLKTRIQSSMSLSRRLVNLGLPTVISCVGLVELRYEIEKGLRAVYPSARKRLLSDQSWWRWLFWPGPIYWDINFVLKCLPAHCVINRNIALLLTRCWSMGQLNHSQSANLIRIYFQSSV